MRSVTGEQHGVEIPQPRAAAGVVQEQRLDLGPVAAERVEGGGELGLVGRARLLDLVADQVAERPHDRGHLAEQRGRGQSHLLGVGGVGVLPRAVEHRTEERAQRHRAVLQRLQTLAQAALDLRGADGAHVEPAALVRLASARSTCGAWRLSRRASSSQRWASWASTGPGGHRRGRLDEQARDLPRVLRHRLSREAGLHGRRERDVDRARRRPRR
jgi:hypothetical protein